MGKQLLYRSVFVGLALALHLGGAARVHRCLSTGRVCRPPGTGDGEDRRRGGDHTGHHRTPRGAAAAPGESVLLSIGRGGAASDPGDRRTNASLQVVPQSTQRASRDDDVRSRTVPRRGGSEGHRNRKRRWRAKNSRPNSMRSGMEAAPSTRPTVPKCWDARRRATPRRWRALRRTTPGMAASRARKPSCNT